MTNSTDNLFQIGSAVGTNVRMSMRYVQAQAMACVQCIGVWCLVFDRLHEERDQTIDGSHFMSLNF